MKLRIFPALGIALLCAVNINAKDVTGEVIDTLPQPDKRGSILAIEQTYGISFLQETPSKNGQLMRWQFMAPEYNSIPVVVDVIAYPSPTQIVAAIGGAEAEAELIFNWLRAKKKK